jgi:hypothetical protein
MRKRVLVAVLAVFCAGMLLVWWLHSPKAHNNISSSNVATDHKGAQTSVSRATTIEIAQVHGPTKSSQTSNASTTNASSSLERITNALGME